MTRNYNCLKNIAYPSFFVIIIIILYSILLNFLFGTSKDNDILIRLRSRYCGNLLNGWTMSHFIFFAYLGYKYPKCFEEAMTFGILWELLEYYSGEYIPIYFPEFARNIDPNWTSWYYGCWEDILMNAMGFLFGKWLNKKLK